MPAPDKLSMCVRRISLAEAPEAANWMRHASGGVLQLLGHFWERLPQASKFTQPDFHLIAVLPEQASFSPVVDWGVCRGVMLYVPHAHRAEVFAIDSDAAGHLAMYLGGWERLLRNTEANNSPITDADNTPAPLQFITGDAVTIRVMLPQMLMLVRRRQPAKMVTNYVMVLDENATIREQPNVRPARADDEATLNRWRRLYSQERGILFEANIIDGIRAGNIFVYEVGGQVLSAAKLDIDLPTHVEIGGVYTFPEVRAHGYGTALMEGLAFRIRQQGKIPMLQVDESNTSAYRLYQRLGWKELGQLSRVWLVP
ncbi:MAG: GNAT family N-acetyltransferase [Phycisphaerae bacterium]